MKTPGQENTIVHISADLLAEAREAAREEHRPADELVNARYAAICGSGRWVPDERARRWGKISRSF